MPEPSTNLPWPAQTGEPVRYFTDRGCRIGEFVRDIRGGRVELAVESARAAAGVVARTFNPDELRPVNDARRVRERGRVEV